MSKVFQCDRCGTVIEDGLETEIWADIFMRSSGMNTQQLPKYVFHLCPECWDNWLRMEIPMIKKDQLG